MSKISFSLRLHGELPPEEEITDLLGVTPTRSFRKGHKVGKRRTQPTDVWSLDLARVECNGYTATQNDNEAMEREIQKAARTLQQLAPRLAALNRDRCKVELYLSTIRAEDQGGFYLSGELIAAAAAANLSSIEVSILVMLDEDELEV